MLQGEYVTLRPATVGDVPDLTVIRTKSEVVRWWGRGDAAEEVADTECHTYVVLLGERVVGAIQWHSEEEPDFRHGGMDLYLDPEVHGRGLGTDAVRTMARYLIEEHRFHRLTIDPAAANAAAIRAYMKVGFRPVGIMRQYWRDPEGVWQDGMLLDLIAAELT